MKSAGRRFPRAAADAVAFLGFWMAFVSKLKLDELALGAGAAVVAAVGSGLVRRGEHGLFRPRPRDLALALSEPWYALTGTWAVVLALIDRLAGRRSKARLRCLPFDYGREHDPADRARRALAVLLTTIVPNFIVIGIDRERRLILFHQARASKVPLIARRLGVRG